MVGFFISPQDDSSSVHPGFGIPLCLPAGAKETGNGCLPQYHAQKDLVFTGTDRDRDKTLATIFPAIQAMGQNMGDKIFYLTAKNATGVVAHDTFLLMEEQGYEGKTVVITAKDKMCLLEERSCNPDDCPYAKGHFDRVSACPSMTLQERNMMDQVAFALGKSGAGLSLLKYSLDIASWVDHIICDYNYVFDPNVCLKRFFAEGIRGDYLFLVDEAHNLVRRARDMYSETLVKEDFLAMKRVKDLWGKTGKYLGRCNKEMLILKRQCEYHRP